jgi:hypothetical protein
MFRNVLIGMPHLAWGVSDTGKVFLIGDLVHAMVLYLVHVCYLSIFLTRR